MRRSTPSCPGWRSRLIAGLRLQDLHQALRPGARPGPASGRRQAGKPRRAARNVSRRTAVRPPRDWPAGRRSRSARRCPGTAPAGCRMRRSPQPSPGCPGGAVQHPDEDLLPASRGYIARRRRGAPRLPVRALHAAVALLVCRPVHRTPQSPVRATGTALAAAPWSSRTPHDPASRCIENTLLSSTPSGR